jgi:phage gp45-like
MNTGKLIWAAMALGLASAVLAGDDGKHETFIKVVKAGGDSDVRIELDSDDMGFNLDDLQVGETRSVVDDEGRSILITREEEGFSFNVDGEIVQLPMLHGEHDGTVWIGDETDVDVHVIGKQAFIDEGSIDGPVIITGQAVDEATRQAIEAALQSSGHAGEVTFIDRETAHDGERRVKVIRKQVKLEK